MHQVRAWRRDKQTNDPSPSFRFITSALSFLHPALYQASFSPGNATHIFVPAEILRADATGAVFRRIFRSVLRSEACRLRRFDVITARRCCISHAANANTSDKKLSHSPSTSARRSLAKALGDDLAAVSSDPTQMNGKTWRIKNEKVATELKAELAKNKYKNKWRDEEIVV